MLPEAPSFFEKAETDIFTEMQKKEQKAKELGIECIHLHVDRHFKFVNTSLHHLSTIVSAAARMRHRRRKY